MGYGRMWRRAAAIGVVLLLSGMILRQPAHAQDATPSDVYGIIDFSARLADQLLVQNKLELTRSPVSHEIDVRPMHVYELHVTVLKELYDHARQSGMKPPPLPVSTPIPYSPTDVIMLSRLVRGYLENVYGKLETKEAVYIIGYKDMTPTHVYTRLFDLYSRVARLNGKNQISPDDVYAQIFRAREDLQYILLSLSKGLANAEERKKRMLVTGIYGMSPDNRPLSGIEMDKTMSDVLARALEVRDTLNTLRGKYELEQIRRPKTEDYEDIGAIDVFLQTQFIIAEINLLKQPLNILNITNPAKVFFGKTPSDIHQELKHIDYMLNRLSQVL